MSGEWAVSGAAGGAGSAAIELAVAQGRVVALVRDDDAARRGAWS